MSDPKDCVDEGGTSFWRHNTLKYENIPKTDFEAQHHGWPTYKECWWTMVYGDGLDRDKWTRHFLCPMKYNRLVLFRTHLWHSHNYNFGDSMENGRLVQLFFFKEKGSKFLIKYLDTKANGSSSSKIMFTALEVGFAFLFKLVKSLL